MRDGVSVIDTCKELEQRGADVVGMNCFRGPNTMLPYLKEIRKVLKCHMAALPIPYRTTKDQPTFFNLDDLMVVHVLLLMAEHFQLLSILYIVIGMKFMISLKLLTILELIIWVFVAELLQCIFVKWLKL